MDGSNWKLKLKDLTITNSKIMHMIYYFNKNGVLTDDEKLRLKCKLFPKI